MVPYTVRSQICALSMVQQVITLGTFRLHAYALTTVLLLSTIYNYIYNISHHTVQVARVQVQYLRQWLDEKHHQRKLHW